MWVGPWRSGRWRAPWGASATFGLGVGAGALWGVLAMSCAVLEAARPGPPPPPPQLYRPLPGLDPSRVLSGFDDARGGRRHEAVDLAAPRGTPVSAVAPGRIATSTTVRSPAATSTSASPHPSPGARTRTR